MGRNPRAGTLSGVSVGLSSWGVEEVWRWRQHRQLFTECDRERESRLCSLEGDSGSEEGIILRGGEDLNVITDGGSWGLASFNGQH